MSKLTAAKSINAALSKFLDYIPSPIPPPAPHANPYVPTPKESQRIREQLRKWSASHGESNHVRVIEKWADILVSVGKLLGRQKGAEPISLGSLELRWKATMRMRSPEKSRSAYLKNLAEALIGRVRRIPATQAINRRIELGEHVPGADLQLVYLAENDRPEVVEQLRNIVAYSPEILAEFKDAIVKTVQKAKGARRSSGNKVRNKFCYNKRVNGKSLSWIKCEVDKRKRWEPLLTDQGVWAAVMSYADDNFLPRPIKH